MKKNKSKISTVYIRLNKEELEAVRACRDKAFNKRLHRKNFGISSYLKHLVLREIERQSDE